MYIGFQTDDEQSLHIRRHVYLIVLHLCLDNHNTVTQYSYTDGENLFPSSAYVVFRDKQRNVISVW